MLPEQVEQRRLERRHRMNRDAQVERLLPSARSIAIGETRSCLLQQPQVITDRLPDDDRLRFLDGLPDLFTAGDFADAGAPRIVGDDGEVAREERRMRARQVEQHAVATGDGNHAQVGDAGCSERGHQRLLIRQ